MPLLHVSGARINYLRVGTGPAILMIQGAGLIGEGWRPQIDALAHAYTIVAPDNRGFGGSILDNGRSVTIDAMASDALAVMDAERIDRFHLVGHSMGGLIAQAVALRSRDRVKSLSLLCTFVRGAEGATMSAAMMAIALRMRIGTKEMRRNAFLEMIMPRTYLQTADRRRLAQEMAPLFGYDLANQPTFVMRQVRAMGKYDAADRWRDLADIPTLIVCAAHDRLARPAYARTLASLLPNARFIEFGDAGHGVTIQCADRVNALLREHFTRS